MPRIARAPARGLRRRLAYAYARRRFGKVPQPLEVQAHHLGVMTAVSTFELMLGRWNKVPANVTMPAVLRSAQLIDCPWCVDFGGWLARSGGALSEEELNALPHWRDAAVFTPVQRAALAYAEAASATPCAVTDALVEDLRQHLDEAQVVELAMMVAVEHLRSRFNAGLGVTSQSFATAAA